MSNSIAYLTSRTNFLQVSPDIPITKQRNPEKFDPPDVFEGMCCIDISSPAAHLVSAANKKELVADLIVKAKQVEYLIKSLPEPEPEEEQASGLAFRQGCPDIIPQANRLMALEEEVRIANAEYIHAVNRASTFPQGWSCSPLNYNFSNVEDLHRQVADMLRTMLNESDVELSEETPG
jgi:mediator of RNA polymerase II transcription subunit 21